MKVLIIEDEQPASKKLIRLLNEIDKKIEIIEVLQSVEESTIWFHNNQHLDLIFMDIQLEDGTCFEIFETCKISTPVIFTTAFDEYTLKAFKVNSVDYLLKPINSNELKNAIKKFNQIHNPKTNLEKIEAVVNQLQPKKKERFLIKVGEHFKSVLSSDICCFFINERCNFINTKEGKNYAIDYSLDKIEQMVDPNTFFRINRNFIINYAAIQDVISYSSSRLRLVLSNWQGENILVSRERVQDFKKWLDR